MSKNAKRLIALLIGVCLWIFYVLEEEMAGYGIYTVIDYNTHELAGCIPFLCTGITIAYFIYLCWKVIKKIADKWDRYFVVILFVLVLLQGNYMHQEHKEMRTTVYAQVESVDEIEEIIVIQSESLSGEKGEVITLESPMLVNNMVEIGGQEYLITYSWKKENPLKGKLQMIQRVE